MKESASKIQRLCTYGKLSANNRVKCRGHFSLRHKQTGASEDNDELPFLHSKLAAEGRLQLQDADNRTAAVADVSPRASLTGRTDKKG